MLDQLSPALRHCFGVVFGSNIRFQFSKNSSSLWQLEQATQPNRFAEWQQLGLHASHLKRLQEFQTAQGQQQFAQIVQLIQKTQ